MIVKGAVAFSRAKQLLQLLGAAWQRGRDGAFVPFLTVEGWGGAGGGLRPSAAAPERLHRFWSGAAPWIPVPNRQGGMCPCTARPWPGGQGSPLSIFTGWAGVPPSPARVCTGQGDRQEPRCTRGPLHDRRQEAFGLSPGNRGLSSRDGPFFPCRISESYSFPVALRSLPRWQGTP